MPGQHWRYMRAKRDQEKQNDLMIQKYMMQKEDQRKKTLEAREFQRNLTTIQLFSQALSGAQSAQERDQILDRHTDFMKDFEKREPFLAKAFGQAFPKDMRKLKEANFLRNHPKPQKQFKGEKPEDNYFAYMSDLATDLKYKKFHARQVDNTEVSIAGTVKILDGKMAMRITDEAGNFELVNMEMASQDPIIQEHMKTHNISFMEIMSNGGDYNKESHTLIETGTDGTTRQVLFQSSDNIFSGSKIKEVASTGRANKPRHGEPPKLDTDAKEFIVALQADKKPKSEKGQALWKDIEEISEDYLGLWEKAKGMKNPEERQKGIRKIERAYTQMLEKKFQSQWPGYSLVVVGPDKSGRLDKDTEFFGQSQMKLRRGSYIKPIYGSRQYLRTKDGVGVQFILDQANNVAWHTNGTVVEGKTIEAAQALIGGMTKEEWADYVRGL